MQGAPQTSVTQFFSQLRYGDRDAAKDLWDHYGHRMLGLARKVLKHRDNRFVDAEDAVQSAFRSFWQRAERGDFGDGINRDGLWNLLGKITLCKALKHQERENTQKRGDGRVFCESAIDDPSGGKFHLDDVLDRVVAEDFDLTCEEMLLELDDVQRSIALMRMMNHTNAEIATLLTLSVSSVERKLRLIRNIWKGHLPAGYLG
ncbi:MAG: hypothetical protein HOH82_09740 [Planctomycetaceae bacterium]|jgi:DNA-directed RNA polymerase specialized sigma24 family protein|nr:hypothetical protein [Planctomycetaceae bacterium]